MKPYSMDLRQRVMNTGDAGLTIQQVAHKLMRQPNGRQEETNQTPLRE
jgi:hypothetical protein